MNQIDHQGPVLTPSTGTAAEVLQVALRLGLTSFGGPIAHIGYFQRSYVQQRRWLSSQEFAELVALCQLMPGPTSSQIGFLIGLKRAGVPGALAAWFGFTLPSALIMLAFVIAARSGFAQPVIMKPLLHGLNLVAVAIVAQALLTMARNLCPDVPRAALASGALALMLLFGGMGVQSAVLALSGVLGIIFKIEATTLPMRMDRPLTGRGSAITLFIFAILFITALGCCTFGARGLAGLAAIFFRAGAMVFGGGHVVLPLLRDALVPNGWLSDAAFVPGYGAAQALPGPLFAIAAYLGGASAPAGTSSLTTLLWAATALTAIFLPGLLLATGALSAWQWFGRHDRARAAIAGINAGVVGLLGAALYHPIMTTALLRPIDAVIALAGFITLVRWQAPPMAVVALTVMASILVG